MTTNPVIIKIPRSMWKELNLDDVHMYERALAALYIGRGPEYLRELVHRSADDPEVVELLRVAPLLGLRPADRLVSR